MRTGRVTSPVVDAAMELRALVVAEARRDNRITETEQKVIDWCRKVVYLADRADVSVRMSNALLGETGIDSGNAERVWRETKSDRLRLLEPMPDDKQAA